MKEKDHTGNVGSGIAISHSSGLRGASAGVHGRAKGLALILQVPCVVHSGRQMSRHVPDRPWHTPVRFCFHLTRLSMHASQIWVKRLGGEPAADVQALHFLNAGGMCSSTASSTHLQTSHAEEHLQHTEGTCERMTSDARGAVLQIAAKSLSEIGCKTQVNPTGTAMVALILSP